MKSMIPQNSQNPLLVFIIVGLVLMLGIILASENLNAILPADKPVMAATIPAPTAIQTVTPTPISTPTSNTITDSATSLDTVSSVLNNPQNFRVVPKDIKPAQAIIEGKTIKFLMGF